MHLRPWSQFKSLLLRLARVLHAQCRYLTTIDLSHHTMIMDLKWLPGIEISSRGKVTKAAEGNKECNFLATTAGDGKVRARCASAFHDSTAHCVGWQGK